MSVICCKVYKDRIEIASDSIITKGWTKSKSDNVDFTKLLEINDMVIGSCGTCEEASLFYAYCSTRTPQIADNRSWQSCLGIV